MNSKYKYLGKLTLYVISIFILLMLIFINPAKSKPIDVIETPCHTVFSATPVDAPEYYWF